jgi:NAD(P)-dependent dehydrogenase (short-subunit alcohol dehydrogenase family)
MATNKDLSSQTIFGIKGLVAVITNGATGIGLMAAHTLAANGARVYIVSRRQDYLQKAVEIVNAAASSGGELVP